MTIHLNAKRTGENVKFFREQLQLETTDLAEKTSRTNGLIESVEAGEIWLDVRTVQELANALNVHPNQIMAWEVREDEE